jgi:hypothetical protein
MSINFYKNKLAGSNSAVMSKSPPRGLTALTGRKDAFQETHQREVIGEQPARSYPAAEPKPELLLPPIFTEGALRFPVLGGKSRMDTVWEGPMGAANPAHTQVL